MSETLSKTLTHVDFDLVFQEVRLTGLLRES